MRVAVAMALIGAVIASVGEGLAATITVHPPDGEGRVFVDLVGSIIDGDFQTFKEKTEQFSIGRGPSKSRVVVTLVSEGGSISSALQIGNWMKANGMSTFVPGDRMCTSACALIWLAGVSRTVGDSPRIGFHASFDPATRRETGVGNALVGAYLRDLGMRNNAIVFMTRKGPDAVEWLTPDLAMEFGVTYALLEPSRTIPLPPQVKQSKPPPQVIEAWSKWARSVVTPSPQTLPTAGAGAPVAPASPVTNWSLPPSLQPRWDPSPRDGFWTRPQERERDGGVQRDVRPRAILYEEDPADPNGKRFTGSAIWRSETVRSGPGEPSKIVVRGDIEIPDRRLAMTIYVRRNTDKMLPASHTVEILFDVSRNFPFGGISNVPGVLMKQAEQTRGSPLTGLAVKVTPDSFILGLSSVEAERERNLQLLKDRGWFDIPIVYNNGRRAIVAIEKGNPGEQAFKEAFIDWEKSDWMRALSPSKDARDLGGASRAVRPP